MVETSERRFVLVHGNQCHAHKRPKEGEGYMRISASMQDVPEYHMNKVMITSVGPQE
jgi:hypothetical protein